MALGGLSVIPSVAQVAEPPPDSSFQKVTLEDSPVFHRRNTPFRSFVINRHRMVSFGLIAVSCHAKTKRRPMRIRHFANISKPPKATIRRAENF